MSVVDAFQGFIKKINQFSTTDMVSCYIFKWEEFADCNMNTQCYKISLLTAYVLDMLISIYFVIV